MPRLFTGLEIPADIASDLSLLRGGLFGARWIEMEDYHLTLRFIGDIDEATAREIHSKLERVQRKSFTVAIDGLGSFGGAKPRALIARARPARALIELQAQQERLMRSIGLPPEARKFTPHVTLARLRSASSSAVAEYLSVRGGIVPRVFEAKRFVLFSSRASSGGGPYVIEAAYPLG
ncbi:MAG: RNA 2',3'-cyclic phosphodiesterase [Methylocapsa sp.]|nr:RNA 2',3'-cyclic phosphodiesterase [Methylocapsa sp.]